MHHPSSAPPPWPSDDHRPNFNHQFDPYVQYPNHHPGPPFVQPNYPPQYPHHPPAPPPLQHQPPFQHQHPPPPPPPPPPPHQLQQPYQQNNWKPPEFHNHPPDYRHQPHFNGEANGGFGNGGPRPNCGNHNANLGRKRPRNHLNKADHADAPGIVKLYVAQVPRIGTEEAVRPLFEVHGDIVEIVILRDKITGQQQGSCFVKYATTIEADRAIRALDNQYTFPGEMIPINVKYAAADRERDWDRDRDRLGVLEKLYVGSLNKNTTKREIEEVFSPFGFVEDIYIMRDDLKQSRGCAFLKYARRDMALEAIKALNGIFTMRGCDQPLIVRLAEPKKPRVGEQRSNYIDGPNFGHHPQPFRPEPPFGPPAGGCFPNNSYPGQQNPASLGPPKNAPFAPNIMQKPYSQIQESSPSFAQMTSQPMRTGQQVCQPPTQTEFSKMQNQAHCQQPWQDSHQQPNLPVHENTPPTAHGVQTFSSTPNSSALRPCSRVEVSSECDWSEHTCPDGFKYFYNCVTYESSWEKPEELALFEHQLKQERLQKPNHQLHSSLSGLSSPEMLPEPNLCSQKLEVQSSSAVRELDCMQLQSKASPVVSPARV